MSCFYNVLNTTVHISDILFGKSAEACNVLASCLRPSTLGGVPPMVRDGVGIAVLLAGTLSGKGKLDGALHLRVGMCESARDRVSEILQHAKSSLATLTQHPVLRRTSPFSRFSQATPRSTASTHTTGLRRLASLRHQRYRHSTPATVPRRLPRYILSTPSPPHASHRHSPASTPPMYLVRHQSNPERVPFRPSP